MDPRAGMEARQSTQERFPCGQCGSVSRLFLVASRREGVEIERGGRMQLADHDVEVVRERPFMSTLHQSKTY